MWIRIAAGIIGALAMLAGIVAFGYATGSLEDFKNPNVSFWTALLGNAVMWLMTFSAFALGIHFLKYGLTGRPFRVNPSARALILGVVSFFPGFVLSAPLTLLIASYGWPRNSQAENWALVVSALIGVTVAIVVCIFLLKKVRQIGLAQ